MANETTVILNRLQHRVLNPNLGRRTHRRSFEIVECSNGVNYFTEIFGYKDGRGYIWMCHNKAALKEKIKERFLKHDIHAWDSSEMKLDWMTFPTGNQALVMSRDEYKKRVREQMCDVDPTSAEMIDRALRHLYTLGNKGHSVADQPMIEACFTAMPPTTIITPPQVSVEDVQEIHQHKQSEGWGAWS